MEFAKEVIREVICERINYSNDNANVENQTNSLKNIDTALNEAETFLSNGFSISIHILIGHTNCKAIEPIACKANCLIEVWTLQITSYAVEETVNIMFISLF